ncbi:cardiolipin synthase [Microlunatus lacustris]
MSWLLSSVTGVGLLAALEVLVVLLALAIAPRGRRPSSALAWILLIALVPIFGVLLFLLIGSPSLPASRRAKQEHMNEQIEERSQDIEQVRLTRSTPPWLPSVVELNRTVGAMPMLEGNDARLITDFSDQIAALTAAADSAHRYLHVEFYILILDSSTEPLFAAMRRAVQRGVKVRVLLDHLGSRGYRGYRRTCRALTEMGAEWHLMLPVQPLRGRYQRPDLRNHRKLLVADGDVALVGSLNIIHPSYHKRANLRRGLRWHDLIAEVSGPVAHEIDAVFVTDWYSETDELLTSSREQADQAHRQGELLCQVAPSGPAFKVENNLALFNTLIYYAQRRLSITSPYFVPDESLLAAITTAARRGVAVELFIGEIGDQFFVFHAQHSYYADLLEAGVRIYRYPAPAILHAKHMSVDEQVTVLGSSNMDIRSFQLNLELSLMVCSEPFTEQMRAVEDRYRQVSHELTLLEWEQHRSPGHRFVDDVAGLTSAVQ